MANNMYTRLFMQVNKLFKEDYLLKDNIPDDILNWIYNYSGINLNGKVLQIDAVSSDINIFIIKDNNCEPDFNAKDIILLDNKPCKVIAISKNFLDRDMEDVQQLIFNIYKFILEDLFKDYPEDNLLNIINSIAPFILTINTMQSFGLVFSYKVFKIQEENKNMYNILIKSCDYNIEDLLDKGLILKIMFSEE